MPYIEKEATVDDIQDLINWLETKTGSYDASDPWQCAIAQYLRDRGHQYVRFDGMYELHADNNVINLPPIIRNIVYGENHSMFVGNRHRFSNALARARTVHSNMFTTIIGDGNGTEATKDDDIS